jgi:hypothetical protein
MLLSGERSGNRNGPNKDMMMLKYEGITILKLMAFFHYNLMAK